MHAIDNPGMLGQNTGSIPAKNFPEDIAMAETGADSPKLPKSLGEHTVAQERLDVILPFVEALSETAVKVGDTLPLDADASDIIRVLESEGK
ncbi:MAG: hypothetical protein DIU57_004890 [Pseudomonadota bacterium]|nr:MAG: hypothetical protein DIU57_17735 [Pseudomonadota bacterium]